MGAPRKDDQLIHPTPLAQDFSNPNPNLKPDGEETDEAKQPREALKPWTPDILRHTGKGILHIFCASGASLRPFQLRVLGLKEQNRPFTPQRGTPTSRGMVKGLRRLKIRIIFVTKAAVSCLFYHIQT